MEECKELKESLSKCRCCQRLLIDDRRAIEIDDIIRERFYNLTSLTLVKIDILANRICQLCASDLATFSSLRADLIEKQNSLYAMAGLEVTSDNDENYESVAITLDEDEEVPASSDQQDEAKTEKIEYEYIDQDFDDTTDVWVEDEEAVEVVHEDENENSNSCDYDAEEDDRNLLKIEKIENRKRSRDEMEVEEYFDVYDQDTSSYVTTKDDESAQDDVMVKCTVCEIEVIQSFYDQHAELMHVINISCDKCGEMFKSSIKLRKHIIENHTADNSKASHKMKRRSFFCALCDKTYEYKKYLVDHVRSFHKKERNRQCPICHRCFYERDIKKHINHVHGEKKVKCSICGNLYTCLENLKLHMRYHEEPKFSCEFENCGKKFHQKTLYESHVLKHSAEKQVDCTQCGMLFYTIRDLKRHTSRVHTKVTRKCFGCDATFYRKDKYREHVIKQHKELTDEERETALENIKEIKWNEV